MKIFDFDAAELRETYRGQGWIHVPGGATAEFCEYVSSFAKECAQGGSLSGKGIRGAKDQFLLEFPPRVDYTAELFDHIATLCDLRRPTMTLSERHVKMYQADADPHPRPHKDRYASQVAVGISIEVPRDSWLTLYPYDARETNSMLRAGLIETLRPEEQPEVVLRGARPVDIHDEPGDVQVFPGSAVWHFRHNSAGTVIVYLKLNDFDCDPLAEDPLTPTVRERTLALLDGTDELGTAVVRIARRFESVTREYARADWRDSLLLNVWDQPPRRITEDELAVLISIDGATSVERVVAGVDPGAGDRTLETIRRLGQLGALDLVSAAER